MQVKRGTRLTTPDTVIRRLYENEFKNRSIYPPEFFSFALGLLCSRQNSLQPHASEPCMTLLTSPGPMVLTHHRFRTPYTPGRRDTSPGPSSLQYYTVCRAVRPPSSVNITILDDHSRDCRRSVLPMYDRVVTPRPSYNEGCPVGTCGPHRCRVLGFDYRACDKPRHFLSFIRRRPRVHRRHPWTYRIHHFRLPDPEGFRLRFLPYVLFQPMAG